MDHVYEAVMNIKTVRGYSLETGILQTFTAAEKASSSLRWNHLAGLAFGISQFILFNTISLAFWYGSRLLQEGRITIQELMKAFCSLYFACFQIAQQDLSDLNRSKHIFRKIQDISAERSALNETEVLWRFSFCKSYLTLFCIFVTFLQESGTQLPMCKGEILFNNVTFSYPTRPARLVFKQFNLRVPAGNLNFLSSHNAVA